MKRYKRAYELSHAESKAICDYYGACNMCPLLVTNGCLRSVSGFTKQEINMKVEVIKYGSEK